MTKDLFLKIESERKKKKLTVKETASLIGIQYSYYSKLRGKYLFGKNEIDIKGYANINPQKEKRYLRGYNKLLKLPTPKKDDDDN